MKHQKYNRRSIRLNDYDYSQAGAYFITICTQNRDCLFGNIVNGEMVLNDAGKMVQTIWDGLADYYRRVKLDAWVIMPNHVHGIINIVGADSISAHDSVTPRDSITPRDSENWAEMDSAHTDSAHTDSTHTDFVHTDFVHTDSADMDSTHTDSVHTDFAYNRRSNGIINIVGADSISAALGFWIQIGCFLSMLWWGGVQANPTVTWSLLATLDETSASVPAPIQAVQGTTRTIAGYMVPLNEDFMAETVAEFF